MKKITFLIFSFGSVANMYLFLTLISMIFEQNIQTCLLTCKFKKNIMNTRERIVETASRLFYTQGYNSTGINQVIKEAEIAKASLYQYFPSKEDLLLEYLHVTALSTNDALQKIVDKHNTPIKKVLALFDFLIDFSVQREFQGCNFLNIASEIPRDNEKVRALIQKQKNHIRALFSDILKPINKEDLADELYVLFDGALISGKVFGEEWPIKITRKIVKKLL